VRLAKYLATVGVASRRASEQLVRSGRVRVGDEIVTDPAREVTGSDDVTLDNEPVGQPPAERIVYAVNKPAGVVSTASDTHGRPTVTSLVRGDDVRLYPVGRLDIDTTGLILLTNDGQLAHRLTHPSFEVPKTYRVLVGNPPLRGPALRALRDGVELDDGCTAPARVRRLAADKLEITIHEGRKRQVRRMCERVGHPVRRLQRVAIGALRLGNLVEGGYRQLGKEEIARLLSAGPRSEPAGRRRSASCS
jgi:23S rRNA pseudouridine2605 synthase